MAVSLRGLEHEGVARTEAEDRAPQQLAFALLNCIPSLANGVGEGSSRDNTRGCRQRRRPLGVVPGIRDSGLEGQKRVVVADAVNAC
jgi:hypothetical protein